MKKEENTYEQRFSELKLQLEMIKGRYTDEVYQEEYKGKLILKSKIPRIHEELENLKLEIETQIRARFELNEKLNGIEELQNLIKKIERVLNEK